MNDVRRISNARGAVIACGVALLCAAGSVLADEQDQTTRPAPTKEQREKMAVEHDQIAACLRSDRAIEECHKEMMQHHMMHHHPSMDQATAQPEQK
jgi:hypothetical protein